ncbi:MAG: 4Fe-4S ferredoxin, partial [Chloroflexota bacterium]
MKHIFVRPDLCTACKTCELACAVEHSQAKSIFASPFETPRPMNRVFVEASDGRKIPIFCRHCDDAPCVAACISGAMFRDPLTIQDVVNSRIISTPLHFLECCVISDGGGAVVMTSADRARDLKQKPVYILGVGEAVGVL